MSWSEWLLWPKLLFIDRFKALKSAPKTTKTGARVSGRHSGYMGLEGYVFSLFWYSPLTLAQYDLRLMTFDLRVISHVLSTSGYEKPWQTRAFLGRLIGRGIFSMEGSAHTMQRRIIAPAFTHESVKQMTPVFFKKADELAEKWKDIIAEKVGATAAITPPRPANAIIDVAHWISRASFDVIGLAGFNYDFHALTDESEKVYGAYRRMFNIADKRLGLWQVLELYFPILRKIWACVDFTCLVFHLTLCPRWMMTSGLPMSHCESLASQGKQSSRRKSSRIKPPKSMVPKGRTCYRY